MVVCDRSSVFPVLERLGGDTDGLAAKFVCAPVEAQLYYVLWEFGQAWG